MNIHVKPFGSNGDYEVYVEFGGFKSVEVVSADEVPESDMGKVGLLIAAVLPKHVKTVEALVQKGGKRSPRAIPARTVNIRTARP